MIRELRPTLAMSIASNLAAIHERIALAAKHAGRDAGEIKLMAVSKTQTADKIIEAYDAGQRQFGENRVQEFAEKFPCTHQTSAMPSST